MLYLLEQLFKAVWQKEALPREWREGLIYKEDTGNYRGITLLDVVGKVFCKILNNGLVDCMDMQAALHEGQAGFIRNRSCIDNVYQACQGR